MQCPTCHGTMNDLPACPYPARHCHLCGTLVHGSEEDRQTIVPTLIGLMHDFRDECLRDDRGQCCVYELARQAAGMVEP